MNRPTAALHLSDTEYVVVCLGCYVDMDAILILQADINQLQWESCCRSLVSISSCVVEVDGRVWSSS